MCFVQWSRVKINQWVISKDRYFSTDIICFENQTVHETIFGKWNKYTWVNCNTKHHVDQYAQGSFQIGSQLKSFKTLVELYAEFTSELVSFFQPEFKFAVLQNSWFY